MTRYTVQERGQPWPVIIGSMSIPMRLWYGLLVRPWFTLHQRTNPWHWRVWDNETRDWVMDGDQPRTWHRYGDAEEWADIANYGRMS